MYSNWGNSGEDLYFRTCSLRGLGWGSMTKGVVLNRKCRAMEYSLSARLFTLVGFDELVGTHLSIFCLLLFFLVLLSLRKWWIADKVNISTQINKRSFGKNTVYQYFSLWEAGLQGAVCQPQKSLTMAALAVRCHLIQIRLVNLWQSCNFYHDQLPGFLRDDKNRIQSLRSEWNNRVLVHVSWTSISLPLQKKSSAIFLILVIRP